MTYDETKAYLSQYYYAYQKVDSLKEELRCLEELANGTQGINYDEPVVQKSRSLKAPFISIASCFLKSLYFFSSLGDK